MLVGGITSVGEGVGATLGSTCRREPITQPSILTPPRTSKSTFHHLRPRESVTAGSARTLPSAPFGCSPKITEGTCGFWRTLAPVIALDCFTRTREPFPTGSTCAVPVNRQSTVLVRPPDSSGTRTKDP